jgi:hypothetical protein
MGEKSSTAVQLHTRCVQTLRTQTLAQPPNVDNFMNILMGFICLFFKLSWTVFTFLIHLAIRAIRSAIDMLVFKIPLAIFVMFPSLYSSVDWVLLFFSNIIRHYFFSKYHPWLHRIVDKILEHVQHMMPGSNTRIINAYHSVLDDMHQFMTNPFPLQTVDAIQTIFANDWPYILPLEKAKCLNSTGDCLGIV